MRWLRISSAGSEGHNDPRARVSASGYQPCRGGAERRGAAHRQLRSFGRRRARAQYSAASPADLGEGRNGHRRQPLGARWRRRRSRCHRGSHGRDRLPRGLDPRRWIAGVAPARRILRLAVRSKAGADPRRSRRHPRDLPAARHGIDPPRRAARQLGTPVRRVHAIDTFVSADSPLEPQNFAVARLGAGAVARALDNSSITPPAYVDSLAQLARARGIALQIGTTNGGNDGSTFTPYGVVDVPMGWPLRYSHSPAEVIDLKDLVSLADMIRAVAEDW